MKNRIVPLFQQGAGNFGIGECVEPWLQWATSGLTEKEKEAQKKEAGVS